MFLAKAMARRLFNEQAEGGEGGGGFDMNSAVDSIGADLGFGSSEDRNDDLEDLGLDGDGSADRGSAPPALAPGPAPSPAPAAPAPSPAPTPAPAAPAPSPAPAAASTPPRFTADAPPTTWTPGAAAAWGTLPESVRAEIAKRENEMFAGISQYRADAGFAKEVKQFLAPVAPALQQHGVTPQQFVNNLINAHLLLASDKPAAERQALAVNLLKSYGIEFGQPAAPADDYVDPQVKALRDEIASLKSQITGTAATVQSQQQRQIEEARSKLAQEIDTFAADPANQYFDDVAEDIAAIIKATGAPLKEAYEKAIWANPTTRAKLIAAQETAAIEKKAQEDAARAAAAAKANKGRGVKTSGHQGSGTAAAGSMEDTMAETLAAIRKRGQ